VKKVTSREKEGDGWEKGGNPNLLRSGMWLLAGKAFPTKLGRELKIRRENTNNPKSPGRKKFSKEKENRGWTLKDTWGTE